MTFLKKVAKGSLILSYMLIALEIIIMVSPFAFYFYSFYGPSLRGLYAFPVTRWLTAFFLPHILLSNDMILNLLDRISFYLFPVGLWIFIVGAIHIYGAKLLRKGPVTNGLYAFVRHPQYLGLIVSGLGLLLFWPRFFILVMYVTMVFIYYHLARHEERTMERRYGEAYINYKKKTGMFLPRKVEGLFSPLQTKRLSPLLVYVLSVSITLGFGFFLMGYSERHIPGFDLNAKDMKVIYSYPGKDAEMRRIVGFALADERTKFLLQKSDHGHKISYLIHIVPSHHGMRRLIAAVSQTLQRPKRIDWEDLKFPMTLLFPFIGWNHHDEYQGQEERLSVIFSKLSSFKGEYVHISKALNVNTRRTPLLLAEVDSKTGKVLNVVETMPRHFWGDMPMPAF
jgi:protein-S-isoprenylcysteine O-methyltransferase Ste14